MAVQMGPLIPCATLFDNATLELGGVWGVHSLSVGTSTYVYAAGFEDDGISGFRLGADGSFTSVANVTDSGALELDGAMDLASATVDGTTYLYATGAFDDGISAFRVNLDGSLTSVSNQPDTEALELLGAAEVTMAKVGGTSFLIATGTNDDGFSAFRINADGTLTGTASVTDSGGYSLFTACGLATAEVGGRSFVFAAGSNDSGISVFELSADGGVSFRDGIDDADGPNLKLGGVMGLATATAGSVTYLIAAGFAEDGLSVFSVGATGQLSNVCNLSDDATRGLGGVSGLTAFTLDGESFVAAAAQNDSALGLFHLGQGGVLTDVTTAFDTAGLGLGACLGSSFAMVDGVPLLVASGYADGGLNSFELGGGNDTLTGTAQADLLLGLAGDDRLDGLGGADTLRGGSGDDLYVVDSAGDMVAEQDASGIDSVRASVSHSLSANLENLTLLGSATLDGTGNGRDNGLTGNGGANTLRGQDGRDTLLGLSGVDKLYGGLADDWLDGGAGQDWLTGESGADDFIFSALSDSGPSASARDHITDFLRGSDDIVLTAIDARTGKAGDQAFVLDTNGSFSMGEIRQTKVSEGLLIEMNLDRDGKAEMSIMLDGATKALVASDFLL